VADTYVDALTPTTPRGNSTRIRVDGSPNVLSYLRFDVQGVTGTVTTAKLRLYANSATTVGHRVHRVASTTWSEGMLYADRPTVGAIAGSAGAFSAGAYREVDVTSLVTRNGLISLAVTTTSSTAISFGSRESTTKPKLVVTQSN
jgi:acid phosphatase type 7